MRQLNLFTSPECSKELQKLFIENGFDIDVPLRYAGNAPPMSFDSWEFKRFAQHSITHNWHEMTPAFELQQLLKLLPMTIHDNKGDYFELNIIHINPGFWAGYQTGNGRDFDTDCHHSSTMIDALANLVIWCIENDHPVNLEKTKTNQS